MELRADLSEALAKKIRASLVSQKRLAQLSGVSETDLSKIAKGKNAFSVDKLLSIGIALGVKLVYKIEMCDPVAMQADKSPGVGINVDNMNTEIF